MQRIAHNQPLDDDGRGYQKKPNRQVEIDSNVRRLQAPNPRVRSEAARRLGQLQAEPYALLDALRDPNSFVRAAAAESLGHAARPEMDEVIDGLLNTIDDPNDFVCAAAIRALGLLGAEDAREEIIPFLDDPQPHICQAAILALARLGPPEIAAEIAPFLESENYEVQWAAARAVGLLGYRPAGPQLIANLEADLEIKTRTPNTARLKLRKTLIEALARVGAQEAVPLLTAIARDEVGLRSVAVQALIDLNAEEAAPALAHMFADPSSSLRERLVKMMIGANYRAALPFIRPLLRDPVHAVRRAALQAILAWEDQGAAEQVREMALHDTNPYIRPLAVAGLAPLFGERAVPDLQTLVDDANALVREAADEGLTRLGHAAAAGALPPAAVRPGLIPPDLPVDAATLQTALEHWQRALASGGASATPDQVAALDEALTTLILTLRNQA